MAQSEDPLTRSQPFDDADADYAQSQRIRSDIERTRSRMDSTFDALEEKLTPGQLLEEGWHLFKGGSSAGLHRAWRIARQHPMPAAVVGLGLGWLMVESSRRSGRSHGGDGRYRVDDGGRAVPGALAKAAHAVKGAAGSARETLSDTAGKVGDWAGEATDKVGKVAGQAREKVGELAGQAREQASELGGRAKEQLRHARLGFWQLMEEGPLAVGGAALALGVLAGLAVPSTRKEDEWMGETRDHLLDEAKEMGREALEKGKQVATAAVDTVKQEVEHQGLTPDALAEKVRAVGREAKNAVQEEAKRSLGDLTGKVEAPKPPGAEAKVEELEPELARR
jgi:uncharacterized protein DUF3618